MSTRVSAFLVALAALLLPNVCVADSLDRYRASMLPAPTLDDIAAARTAAEQRAHDSPPHPPPTSLSWRSRPSSIDFEAVYPHEAFQRGVGGDVMLECLVQTDGRLACAIASETPPGMGFGEAARLAATRFRLPEHTDDGRPTAGGILAIPMHFRVIG